MKAWLTAVFACLSIPAWGGEVPFYIGTYTSAEGSQGIYRAILDLETGKISAPQLAVETKGPSFLALHPNGKFLYSVNSPTSEVSAFAIQDDGALKLLNARSAEGAGPCHVAVDHGGKNLFVANYGGGSLASFPIEEDGSLAEPATVFVNEGSGPNEKRQQKPHLHAIYPDQSDKFVYACDLGMDEVLVFHLRPETGELKLADPRSGKVPPGGGPRHLALHRSGELAFANNELTSSVTVFRRDVDAGSLEPIQTISTLPEDADVPNNSTAEIFLHPTQDWLYVSNRGHKSIASYSFGDDGKLTLIRIDPAGVAIPRGFGIDPTGQWLVVGGQETNDVTALAIDQQTGGLTAGPNRIEVGQPVCIVFMETATK